MRLLYCTARPGVVTHPKRGGWPAVGGGVEKGLDLPRGGVQGVPSIRASWLAKKSQDKTLGVFFHAAFDFDAPGPQNTTQKSKR